MPTSTWEEIESLVKPWFDQGLKPDRGDLIDLAYQRNASDAAIDALDSLGPRPIESLASLRELLEKSGALS